MTHDSEISWSEIRFKKKTEATAKHDKDIAETVTGQ
jgi:hypothetical protein